MWENGCTHIDLSVAHVLPGMRSAVGAGATGNAAPDSCRAGTRVTGEMCALLAPSGASFRTAHGTGTLCSFNSFISIFAVFKCHV